MATNEERLQEAVAEEQFLKYKAHQKRVSKRLKRQRRDRDIAEGLEREDEDE